MNRTKITFSHPVGVVLAAVTDKVTHHSKRLEWYTDQRTRYDKELREKGLSIQENIAAGISTTYDNTPRVHFDQALLQKFNESTAGVQKHRNFLAEYKQWQAILKNQDNISIDLDYDDIDFFGLARTE